MNSNELSSTPIPCAAMGPQSAEIAAQPQGRTERQVSRYWSAFAASLALLFVLAGWWTYSPGQDHVASIPLNGDGTWYHNYEIAFEIQDQEIFYHGIGHSIESAQQADIIFLGTSRLVFGLDWRVFEEFERKHHLKMFNLGLAGVSSGQFPLRIIRKWGLRPKLWIINADRELRENFRSSYFFMQMATPAAFGPGAAARVVNHSRMRAIKNVLSRNIRWRLKMAAGLLERDPYRSATTGNWYLDNWPNRTYDNNPPIKLMDLRDVNGALQLIERGDPACPVGPEELDIARDYVKAIGGSVVLMQVPSVVACAQRLHELASALAVPSFTVDPTQFSTVDGGGHLDLPSARKYSTAFFGWLEQLPEFQRIFSK
jgi:hypothetical protein